MTQQGFLWSGAVLNWFGALVAYNRLFLLNDVHSTLPASDVCHIKETEAVQFPWFIVIVCSQRAQAASLLPDRIKKSFFIFIFLSDPQISWIDRAVTVPCSEVLMFKWYAASLSTHLLYFNKYSRTLDSRLSIMSGHPFSVSVVSRCGLAVRR